LRRSNAVDFGFVERERESNVPGSSVFSGMQRLVITIAVVLWHRRSRLVALHCFFDA
jgi:hypothetical protein